MRRTLPLLLLVVTLPVLAQAQRRCVGSQLKVAHHSEDAGAGQRHVTYSIKNKSYRRCTLKGFPGFALINRRGRKMNITLEKDGDVSAVSLAPNAKAYFGIDYSSCGVGGTPPCPTSRRVRITPPGTGRAFFVNDRLDPFELRIRISPVRATEESQ